MTNNHRQYSKLDEFCINIDQAVRAMFGVPTTTERLSPDTHETESELTLAERKHAAAIMRINHAGEVCAQALYHSQGLASRKPDIQHHMQQAALEEGDHLAWCSKRIVELGSHTSYLNPVWYAGSFAIGFTAGLIGDKWSLGFVAETETQVVKHLESQMRLLPTQDSKSYKILSQMQADELAHKEEAIIAGAAELPAWVKKIMNWTAKVMVKTAYYF